MELTLKNVSYSYNPEQTPVRYALQNIHLSIKDGEFIGIVGHTGSGKSTLVQLFNGLLLPTGGEVLSDGRNIAEKGFDRKTLRKEVGLVFQYPEHQLFETTVLKDVCFGPKNLGMKPEEQLKAAKFALESVGLDEDCYEKSPFDLSGGEKRRVAIAGVLAMKPKILVLDEPTAGLDPMGRKEILDLLENIYRQGVTVVLVSHAMEDIANYATRVIAMKKREIIFDGAPREFFGNEEKITEAGLMLPEVTKIMKALREKGFLVPTDVLTVEEAKEEILKVLPKF